MRARNVTVGLLVALVAISSCSSDAPKAAGSTIAAPGVSTAPAESVVGQVAETLVTVPVAAADPGASGDCAGVPALADVIAVAGVPLLPVEYSEFTGCSYSGDGNNAGVYFEKLTTPEDLAQFAAPDPQFSVLLTDPDLPGAFVQSGLAFAMKDGVVYSVDAAVNSTEADDQIAVLLLKQWVQQS